MKFLLKRKRNKIRHMWHAIHCRVKCYFSLRNNADANLAIHSSRAQQPQYYTPKA